MSGVPRTGGSQSPLMTTHTKSQAGCAEPYPSHPPFGEVLGHRHRRMQCAPRNKCCSLSAQCSSPVLDQAVYSRFPVLPHPVGSRMQSTNQRTSCYHSKMKPLYIITRSMGETLYRLFDCLFGFQSWRQVERSRSRHRNMLGLQEDAFCLSRENFMLAHKDTCQVIQTLASVFASTSYLIRSTYSSIHILVRLLSRWSP
jgi:hypothetical protein